MLCAVIIGEIDSSEIWRFIAATSIIIAAYSLTVPILHRISKLDQSSEDLSSPVEARNLATIDDEIANLERRIAQLRRVRQSLTLEEMRP